MTGIDTERLVLRLVPLAGLAATINHDRAACRRLIGDVPEVWFQDSWVAEMRLEQWKQDPAYAPWSIRAVIHRHTGVIVGYMNCHDRPRLDDGLSTIELGYDVFDPHRRQGIATEMIKGFTRWAASQGVERVLLSISPGNAASLGLARKLGATKIGSHIDEKDGPEDVYALLIAAIR